jgi:ABC-type Fe3+-siderophore transport system permease subunit
MNQAMTSKQLSPARVRLSDSAVTAGATSLAYAAALMLFPHAFPQILQRVFEGGYFFRTLALVLVITNAILFLLICKRRSQKPDLLTLSYIAFLTITLVSVLRMLVMFADEQAQVSHILLHMPGRSGIGSEELLLYTHLGIVFGIFFPYVLVRLTRDYVSSRDSVEPDAKAHGAGAGE